VAIVYKHIRKDTNEIFYVGIGTNLRRAYTKKSRNCYWKNIAKNGYVVEILHKNLTWEEACIKEVELIKQYGRKDIGTGILANMTDGGEGSLNIVVSDYRKDVASQVHTGEKNVNWKIVNIGDKFNKLTIIQENPRRITNQGKKRMVICECECGTIKEYTLSKVRTGRTKSCGCISKEIKNIGMLGKKHTEEWKQQASIRASQFRHSEETKLKLRKPKSVPSARKGKTISDEHRNNIKLSWIKRKQLKTNE